MQPKNPSLTLRVTKKEQLQKLRVGLRYIQQGVTRRITIYLPDETWKVFCDQIVERELAMHTILRTPTTVTNGLG
ncbi:hypothetical protein Pla100_49170 [Neorhodopirellula pilleata]|uniref:Uncharacterized protein n=1 Tax=Neorhodopirellula pilleata TaxID=2714738 RepID=A0A5C5ZXA0_9BACT|nr:hypothetical protein Pla100_49170 [Neorhodopirellula pilleata]